MLGSKVQITTNKNQLIYPLILACFFASGFAALLYQTAWIRQFAISFGTSEFAVASVLAAYMSGLAAGAMLAAKFIKYVKRPVFVYGFLEGGIALSALAVPSFINAAEWLLILLAGDQSIPPNAGGLSLTVFYVLITFIVLVIPTALMGATLPLLIRYAVRSNNQIGPRIGLLYGINTAGAVIGVISTGFLLLPKLGLFNTIIVGVVVNFIVFLLAVKLENLASQNENTESINQKVSSSNASRNQEDTNIQTQDTNILNFRWIYPLIATSGSTSFLYEVLWTRLLSHILTGSIYAFCTMLASFLIGIAIGGGVAGRFASDQKKAAWLFALAQFAIAITAAAIYMWLLLDPPLDRGLAKNAFLSFLVITPSTFFIGATFPFAVRVATQNAQMSAAESSRIYSYNTAGAILGALGAAFFIIPLFGFSGTIKLAVCSNIALGIAAILLISPKRGAVAWATIAAMCMMAIIFRPSEPMTLVASSALENNLVNQKNSEHIFYSVGRSSTVFVTQIDGHLYLKTNGLPEAQSSMKGAPPNRNTQKWLGAIPFTLRPTAESALVIGYGGGLAVQGIPPSLMDIDVIEIEPEVINANKAIAFLRQSDPLDNPRVNIIINDARGALNLSSKTYSVIISQPSHPWTPGASHLYSKEFITLARSKMKHDGVFLQWINASFIDETLLRSLAATLGSQFEHLRLFQPDPLVLFFVASNAPFDNHEIFINQINQNEDIKNHYKQIGIKSVEDLIAATALDDEAIRALSIGAALNTDDNNLMATKSRALADGLDTVSLESLLAPIDPLLNKNGSLRPHKNDYDIGYLTRRLIETGFESRALDFAKSLNEHSSREFVRGIGLRQKGRLDLAEKAFWRAFETDTNNQQIIYAIVQPYLSAFAGGQTPEHINAMINQLDTPARAVFDGWRAGANGEWKKLSQLDTILNQTIASDFWYPEATKLRIDWRIQLASRQNRIDLAKQALKISDDLLTTHVTADIYALRAAAGLIINDVPVFSESLRAITLLAKADITRSKSEGFKLSNADIKLAKRRLIGMGAQGQKIYSVTGDKQIKSVLSMVDEVVEELNSYEQ